MNPQFAIIKAEKNLDMPKKRNGVLFLFVRKQKTAELLRWFGKNTVSFVLIFMFINLYSVLFGSANVLAGVAVAVAFMTLPSCNFQMRPLQASLFILAAFVGIGIASAVSVLNPWLGFLVNLGFIVIIMLTTCEPMLMKPYVSLLIAYIFCQTTPVHGKDLALRMIGLTLGGIGIAINYWIRCRNASIVLCTFTNQIKNCAKNYKFILRISIGVATAMLIAALLELQKPLWISIVVMSLTQPDIKETVTRIKHRTAATVIGIILFVVLFKILVPPQYDIALVLLCGYLCNFMAHYKHKQIVNAISSLSASLILMHTGAAIANRILCLFGGIAIVLVMFLIEWHINSTGDKCSGETASCAVPSSQMESKDTNMSRRQRFGFLRGLRTQAQARR